MKIETVLRHFDASSAMTESDINRYLEKKFSFLKRNTNEDEVINFKIKKKNPRPNEESKLPKNVYEVSIKGKLKTGDDFIFAKESIDLKNGIDLLASTVKSATTAKIKEKQEKPKGLRTILKNKIETE